MTTNEKIDPAHAVLIGDRVWWVGVPLAEDQFQCHVYLIENGDQSILIDPGGMLTFAQVKTKLEEVIPFDSIRYFICQHQDPDITASLPTIDRLVARKDAEIISHWRAIALLKHYDLHLPMRCIEQSGWELIANGRRLRFVLTPYLHFPGAFCTFDEATGILFSSDLFGGFTEEWSLYAQDEGYFEAIRLFHEHYMPSQAILHYGMLKLEALPLTLIAPQHGSLIRQDLIPFLIDQLKNLECGLFLMTKTSTEVSRLSILNRILRECLNEMIYLADFRQIVRSLVARIGDALPLHRLEFYARMDRLSMVRMVPDDGYRPEPVQPPASIQAFLQLTGPEFYGRYAADAVFLPLNEVSSEEEASEMVALMVPLFTPNSNTMRGVAIFYLKHQVQPDRETLGILMQIGMALSVALEREIIQSTLERERQRFYEESIRDPLTRLYTRVYMRESMQRIFNIQDREAVTQVAVAAFDLDYFKSVNDTYGHGAGDQVLKAIAKIMIDETRAGDCAVRVGGEEFLLFIVGQSSRTMLMVAERIRHKVEALHFEGPMAERNFSISCGIASRCLQESLEALIQRADLALYQAKGNGRNQVRIAEGDFLATIEGV